MTAVSDPSSTVACDALLAAALLAITGEGLGGAILTGRAGDGHELWLKALASLRPDLASAFRLPAGMSATHLSGGIDLAATLATGRRVIQPNIAQRAQARPLLLTGVERWSGADCALLLATVDGERTGGTPLGVILAVDESADGEPGVSPILADRLAFRLPLEGIRPRSLELPPNWQSQARRARQRFRFTIMPEELLCAIVATSLALGIGSSRADALAVMAARAHAAWRGADVVAEEDAEVAVRLVLAPRARQLPAEAQEPESPEDSPQEGPENSQHDGSEHEPDHDAPEPDGLEDRMIEAVTAALPQGLLDLLRGGAGRLGGRGAQGRNSHGQQRKAQWGRPVGHVAGDPRRDGPLHLLATIEKSAPWQTLRRRLMAEGTATTHAERRLLVLPSDIRVTRFKRQAPSLTIFAVDASGSAAMERLGEAKGAVELLLAECYARREQVALIAFRGTAAEVLLPPTRALARARRMLAQLPGGGATPLASGIAKAHELAQNARRAGETSLVVLLTDGRANIDRRGVADRKQAAEHAMTAARGLAADGIAALLVDTASVPSAKAADLARCMNARYLPLPNAGAREIAGAVALGRRSAA